MSGGAATPEGRRIRVLFAIGSLGGGGAELQVVTLLKHLDRERFEPHLYLIRKEGVRLTDVPEDVPIHAFSGEGGGGRRWIRGLSRIALATDLVRVLRRESIDVFYDRTFQMTLLVAPATSRTGVPRVSAAVADPAAEWSQHVRDPSGLVNRYARWCYRSAERVVANSDGLRDRLVDFFELDSDHVSVARNVVDFEGLARRASAAPPPLDPSEFHLLAVGRLHAEKGLDLLVRAVAEVPVVDGRHTRLHLVGEGNAESDLRALAGELGVRRRVDFVGHVDDPAPWYRAADLYLLPSRNEGCPNALIEALACGARCVAADCPSGPREILDGGRHGTLVRVDDLDALTAAVRTGSEPPSPGRDAHLRTLFGHTRVMAQLERILSDAANRNRQPPSIGVA